MLISETHMWRGSFRNLRQWFGAIATDFSLAIALR
jgi:hypothetical protein